MGNCLTLPEEEERKAVRIMTVEGRVLRYPSPLKVGEGLADFPGHAIAETGRPVLRHLDGDADNMAAGKLYYLLPPKKKAAAVPAEEARRGAAGTVRIKVVVSRQELEEMLRRGGASPGEVVSTRRLPRSSGSAGGAGSKACRAAVWRPVLESIPEGNDCC